MGIHIRLRCQQGSPFRLKPVTEAPHIDPPKENKKAVTTVKNSDKLWKLVGGTEHQQWVVKRCQEKLIEKGVNDLEARKYGCSIYLAENESMDLTRLGDGGHAFGICQRNLGSKWAKDFLEANPEWKTLEVQLEWCTERYATAWHKYKNVFQATVEHNCPSCARNNKDACHISPCYSVRVKNKSALFSL